MNIFILNTGRCGSTTLIRACQHITNYTAAHESRSTFLADERLNYPTQHIEADNRLTWFLGQLEERYGDDAFYVHLMRDRTATAASYARRWQNPLTIIRAFSRSILMHGNRRITEVEQLQIACDYYDAATANIRFFLRDKSNQLELHLETLVDDFPQFWEAIGATGDLDAALHELTERFNSSETPTSDRSIFVPKRRKRTAWEQVQLRWAYRCAVYWTNFFFNRVRKE